MTTVLSVVALLIMTILYAIFWPSAEDIEAFFNHD